MAESKLYNRRKFIKTAAIAGAGTMLLSGIPKAFFASESQTKITILHTNDTHSRIDAFPNNGGRNAGMGGVAKRATLINNIRKKEENVLLLDAGDILQGTPYFNMYKGELEFKLMSELGYNACTIGNHEFDGGMDNLSMALQQANFPIIVSNYDFSNTPLENKTVKNHIIDIGGKKIGIYGLGIELEGLVPESLYQNTKYLDALEIAKQQEQYLKHEKKCDLILCLSHLGFEYETNKLSDIIIAKKTQFTNLIIGGHTHTFLDEPKIIPNSLNVNCYVAQVGWGGINLGRIDFIFGEKNTVIVDIGSVMPVG